MEPPRICWTPIRVFFLKRLIAPAGDSAGGLQELGKSVWELGQGALITGGLMRLPGGEDIWGGPQRMGRIQTEREGGGEKRLFQAEGTAQVRKERRVCSELRK